MVHRIEVTTRPDFIDAAGETKRRQIQSDPSVADVGAIRTVSIFSINGDMPSEQLESLGRELFANPITQTFCVDRAVAPSELEYDWIVQVANKPGVKDNVGEISSPAVGRLTGTAMDVYVSMQYAIKGDLSLEQVGEIAAKHFSNKSVEAFAIASRETFGEQSYLELPIVSIPHEPAVQYMDLELSGAHLETEVERINRIRAAASRNPLQLETNSDWLKYLSTDRSLALNLREMEEIKAYFSRPDIMSARQAVGLDKMPTDAELEVLAQTWSEHCKHKIFNAVIEYDDGSGQVREINSLFNTYIKQAAEALQKEFPWIKSILWDNAGVVEFDEGWLVVVKCETHCSPSKKMPHGGAITGIVGVYRDPMGTGKGVKLIYGTYGFYTGDPDYDGELRPEIHPRELLEGVRKGVQDGGNKHGVPTPYGTTYFDEGYIGKPGIFVKAVGIMPEEINGEPAYEKDVKSGDLIVMCGGRVGIDGIHGATESSMEAGSWITMGHVQMGDPYTQKKMHDFLLEARDRGLYRFVQDNGAGGLSSSVGESARFSNGFLLDLAKVPLKYAGLDPWQILISESQERMTLAVDPSRINELLELARLYEVETTVIGEFTETGKYHVVYGEMPVCYMDMDFVHEGVPQMRLKAKWETPEERGLAEPELDNIVEHGSFLREMLARPNIAGKEYMVRQFDHEVQGTSVIKPLVGKDSDVHSDGVVLKPLLDRWVGIATADGCAPRYSVIDTYHATMYGLDESIRKMVAVGADPGRMWFNDNFCWPSPLPSANNPDAEYKAAQLVRANEALETGTTMRKKPCVSGKDSMSMDGEEVDAQGQKHRVSALPTLKFSGDGRVPDVRKCVTMDVKNPGDAVYILGLTKDELGGSEFYQMHEEVGLNVPVVDNEASEATCRAVHEAIQQGLIASCHGVYRGGLGIALAESSFAGGYGIDVDLRKVPNMDAGTDEKVLYSESAGRFMVTVPQDKAAEFERAIGPVAYGRVGTVNNDGYMRVTGLDGVRVVEENIRDLKAAYQSTHAKR